MNEKIHAETWGGAMGSAILTFFGYKQTNKQT